MVSRCVLLCFIHGLLGNAWLLEQPSSSLLEFHPDFQWLMTVTRIYKCFLWMGAYGGSTPKGTWLFSNKKELVELYKPIPPGTEWEVQLVTRSRTCPALEASKHLVSFV